MRDLNPSRISALFLSERGRKKERESVRQREHHHRGPAARNRLVRRDNRRQRDTTHTNTHIQTDTSPYASEAFNQRETGAEWRSMGVTKKKKERKDMIFFNKRADGMGTGA